MFFVEELHNVESATIHIEVNVPSFKIRSAGFPDLHLGIHFFHFAPCCVSDAPAVSFGLNEEQVQLPMLAIDTQNQAACFFTVSNNPICNSLVDGFFYGAS